MTANVHTTMYIDTYISYDIESTVVRADDIESTVVRANQHAPRTYSSSFLSYINTKQHKSLIQHVYALAHLRWNLIFRV